MRPTKVQKQEREQWESDTSHHPVNFDKSALSLGNVSINVGLEVPHVVSMAGDRVEWCADAKATSFGTNYSPKCLKSFLLLGDKPNEQILKFIRVWGPLGLFPQSRQTPAGERILSEPIEEYRSLAKQMRAIISVTVGLRNGKPASKEDQQTALPHPLCVGVRYDRQYHIAQTVTAWLAWLRPSLQVRWGSFTFDGITVKSPDIPTVTLSLTTSGIAWSPPEREYSFSQFMADAFGSTPLACPPVEPRPSPLFAGLVLNLAAVLSNPNRLFRCVECGKGTSLSGGERTSKRYCDECKREVHRASARESKRKRSASDKADRAARNSVQGVSGGKGTDCRSSP